MSSKKFSKGFSRREILKGIGIGAGALAAGPLLKGSFDQAASLLDPEVVSAATFWKGADVSWLQQMEANGYTFFNNSGVKQDCLSILKGFGINAIRLRTWVNPSSDPVSGHCSQSETIAMAVRCKNAGLAVDIDFHFGDTWNDVGHQNPPAAWASLTYSQMLTTIRSYVTNFMKAMQSSGVTPGWVQIGNEINSGILHPVGSLSNPSQMTGLLNTAHDSVKSVFSGVPVLIHLAQPQKTASVDSFFSAFINNGGKWDVTAFSSYAHGSNVPVVISAMHNFQTKYGKPVMQVEYGGPENNPTETKNDLVSFIQGVRGFGGLGVFYWEPETYSPFNTYGSGAWDPNTKEPTAALTGFSA